MAGATGGHPSTLPPTKTSFWLRLRSMGIASSGLRVLVLGQVRSERPCRLP